MLSNKWLTYDAPYVRPINTWKGSSESIPLTLDLYDENITQDQNLTAFLLSWMHDRKIITYNTDDRGVPKVVVTKRGLQEGGVYDIANYNLRRLVYINDLDAFIQSILDNDIRHLMTDIQSLAILIPSLYPESLVNIRINKIYRSMDAIPVEDAELSWDEIHQSYPFMWVILYLQLLLFRFGDMRVVIG